jgi:YVTN family beta-propeller protein
MFLTLDERRWKHLGLLLALPLAAGTVRIYVTNSAGDNVHVIDPVTNRVVQELTVSEVPHGIAISPDAGRLYISSEAENALEVIDRKTSSLIRKVPLSGHPNNIAITRDGRRVYVCIRSDSCLDVVDTASLEKVKSIPVGAGPHNVYLTPDGKYMVAGCIQGHSLTVIDVQTEQPVWDLKFEAPVRPIAFEPGPGGATRRLFVQLSNLHGFAVVDFAARREVKRIYLPDPPPNAVPEIPGTPSHGIGVAPDGKTLWVCSSLNSSVYAYSLPDLKLLGGARVGFVPDWLTFTPDSKRVYVSNSGSNAVSAVDAKLLREIARIPVGQVPKRTMTATLP